MDSVDEDHLFLSVITFAELRLGAERMQLGARRTRLEAWILDELLVRFERRILSVDERTADEWGKIFAHRVAIGRPISAMDAFLAALTRTHGMILATRNIKDFAALDLPLFNPWPEV